MGRRRGFPPFSATRRAVNLFSRLGLYGLPWLVTMFVSVEQRLRAGRIAGVPISPAIPLERKAVAWEQQK